MIKAKSKKDINIELRNIEINSIKKLSEEQKKEIVEKFQLKTLDKELSINNQLLLIEQLEERNKHRDNKIILSLLGGYRQLESIKKRVKTGEKAFYIKVPQKYIKKDAVTNNSNNDSNQEKIFFKYQAVFDISQCEDIKD